MIVAAGRLVGQAEPVTQACRAPSYANRSQCADIGLPSALGPMAG